MELRRVRGQPARLDHRPASSKRPVCRLDGTSNILDERTSSLLDQTFAGATDSSSKVPTPTARDAHPSLQGAAKEEAQGVHQESPKNGATPRRCHQVSALRGRGTYDITGLRREEQGRALAVDIEELLLNREDQVRADAPELAQARRREEGRRGRGAKRGGKKNKGGGKKKKTVCAHVRRLAQGADDQAARDRAPLHPLPQAQPQTLKAGDWDADFMFAARLLGHDGGDRDPQGGPQRAPAAQAAAHDRFVLGAWADKLEESLHEAKLVDRYKMQVNLDGDEDDKPVNQKVASVIREGYMRKKKPGNNVIQDIKRTWERRYLVLYNDGKLKYYDSRAKKEEKGSASTCASSRCRRWRRTWRLTTRRRARSGRR